MSYNGRIPVPGFVSSVRKPGADPRLRIHQKRQEELERLRKQREREEEAARILAHRWAEQDRKKRAASQPLAEEELHGKDRRRRRDSGHGEEGDAPSRRFREAHLHRDGRSADGYFGAEAPSPDGEGGSEGHTGADRPPEEDQPGGWQTIEEPRQEERRKEPRKRPEAKEAVAESSKLRGVFGIDDSDEEKEKARSELARKSTTQRRLGLSLQTLDGEQAGLSSSGSLATASSASAVAAVQMKVAAWKAGLKGKAAKMPIELQREVAAVMGSAPRV